MIEILENATIIYTDGVREHFDAIQLTDKKVITGRLLKTKKSKTFKQYGFILRENVKKIYNGSKIKIQNI